MAYLEVKDLIKNYNIQVLKGVSFTLEKGEVLSIIGSSGGGKTTLLRCMTFLESPNGGSISVGGNVIYDGENQKKETAKSIRNKRLHFGLVFQQFNLFPHYNVIKNITIGPKLLAKDQLKEEYKKIDETITKGKGTLSEEDKETLKKIKDKYELAKYRAKCIYDTPAFRYDKQEALDDAKFAYEIEKAKLYKDNNKVAKLTAEYNIIAGINRNAIALLKRVGLENKKTAYPGELSGGQQQRVAIARALALNPDILCFDEPTSALDPELTGEVLKVIRGLKSKDTTMIIVTHEMEFARDVSDKIIFMADGVIEEMGTPEQIFTTPKSERTKSFLRKYFAEDEQIPDPDAHYEKDLIQEDEFVEE